MNLLCNDNQILVNLYYISGILILLVNSLVLWQIKIAKKAITITDDRQKLETALKYINDFHNSILIKWNVYYENYKSENLNDTDKYFTKSFISNELNCLNKKQLSSYYKLYLRNYKSISDFLNALEVFSVGVNSKIINEDIIYMSIGEAYCEIIEFISVIICINREDNLSSQSKYTIELYHKWKKKLDIKTNEIKLQELGEKYNQISNELNYLKGDN